MFRWKPTLTLLGIALIVASLPAWSSLASDRLPDLVVTITGPSSADAGEPIGHLVTVTVNNLGSVTAPGTTPDGVRPNPLGYTLEIVLSSDDEAPIKPSVYQSKFREDVQLSGGSISITPDVEPNFMLTMWEAGPHRAQDLRIPQDTPTGTYFVCAIVDPRGTVDETDERNNSDCGPLSVSGQVPDSDETPSPSPEPPAERAADEPLPFNVPESATPFIRLNVNEDAPDRTIDLSSLLGDEYAPLDWATVRSNNNPSMVAAQIVRGEVVLQFAKDIHGAAQIVVEGVDEAGFLFEVSVFVDVEPTNDAPVVTSPLGDIKRQAGDGDLILDLLQVFNDVDLHSNHDRLTFKLSNDNTSLLSFSLQNSDLTLHVQPGRHGEANITITAIDQWGLAATDILRLVVDPPQAQAPQANTEVDEPSPESPTEDTETDDSAVVGVAATQPDIPQPIEQAIVNQRPDSEDNASQPNAPEFSAPVEDEIIGMPDPGSSNGPNSMASPTSKPDEGVDSSDANPVETESVSGATPQPSVASDAGDELPTPVPIGLDRPFRAPEVAPPTTPLPPAPASAAPVPAPSPSVPGPEPAANATTPPTPAADPPSATLPSVPTSAPNELPSQPEVVKLAPEDDGRPLTSPALIAMIALAIIGLLAATTVAVQARLRRRG